MRKYLVAFLVLFLVLITSVSIIESDDYNPLSVIGVEPQTARTNPTTDQLHNAFNDIINALQSTSPTPQQLAIRQQITGSPDTPPLKPALAAVLGSMLDGIACREAQRKHYCEKDFCIGVDRVPGHPIRSFDNGYGMYQLTNPAPNFQEKWDWQQNLISTVKRLYPQITYASSVANQFSDIDIQERIYFRELVSRHNASGVAYFETNGSRRPIICREPVAFTHDAPNTSPLYRKNMENNQGLLQAIEMFGKELQSDIGTQCEAGSGRQIVYKSNGTILFVTSCRPGLNQLMNNETKQTTTANSIPANFVTGLQRFGSELIDDKTAGCHGGLFNKNSARRITGTFTEPDQYIIDGVGRCQNSPTCYVDVDVGASPDASDNCMSPEVREEL